MVFKSIRLSRLTRWRWVFWMSAAVYFYGKHTCYWNWPNLNKLRMVFDLLEWFGSVVQSVQYSRGVVVFELGIYVVTWSEGVWANYMMVANFINYVISKFVFTSEITRLVRVPFIISFPISNTMDKSQICIHSRKPGSNYYLEISLANDFQVKLFSCKYWKYDFKGFLQHAIEAFHLFQLLCRTIVSAKCQTNFGCIAYSGKNLV